MAYSAQDNSNGITPSSLRLVFMGTPDFAVPSLMALIHAGYDLAGVVTQPDKPQGRHMILTPPPVKTAALSCGIPVYQPEKIRDPDFLEQMRSLSLDLMITAAYGRILPVSMLDLPRYGALNVHASLLPRYRGAAPVHWCIINGESQTGITIMKMDKGMDTGAILVQKTVEIPFDINTGDLMDRLAVEGAQVLSDTILGYLSGQILPVPQDESCATTVKPITKEDALIDWNTPVLSVYNKIRGCSPWPVAYTDYQGNRLKLYQARIPENYRTYLSRENRKDGPGSILVPEDKSGLLFVCSDGVLEITELQLEGSKRMPAGECAHNFKSIRR